MIGLLTCAALAPVASANRVGVYFDGRGAFASASSFGGGLGLQYQNDRPGSSVRYGLNLGASSLGSSGFALSGDADLLRPFPTQSVAGVQTYYGFGAGATLRLGGGLGGALYPRALVGADLPLPGLPIVPFAEASVGPSLAFGASGGTVGAVIGFGYGLRFGANYQIGR